VTRQRVGNLIGSGFELHISRPRSRPLTACYLAKGPIIKDVRIQGEGVCPVRTRGREFFRCGRPHFLKQNISDFS